MPDLIRLIVPTVLLTLITFVCLSILYSLARYLIFCIRVRSLASELALHYTQAVKLRPPTLGGFYREREVAIDYMDGCTRIRAFHDGKVADEFTVGLDDCFARAGLRARKLGSSNSDFEAKCSVVGNNTAGIRGYMDEYVQSRILTAGLFFTVGRYDASVTEDGRLTDRGRLTEILDFLVEAAARADKI